MKWSERPFHATFPLKQIKEAPMPAPQSGSSRSVCDSQTKLLQHGENVCFSGSPQKLKHLLLSCGLREPQCLLIVEAAGATKSATKSAYCGGNLSHNVCFGGCWSHEICLLWRPLEPRNLLTVKATGATKSAFCGGRWSREVCVLWRPLEPRSLRLTNETSPTWRKRLLLWKPSEAEASASQLWSARATMSAYCGGSWSHEVS
jgi:hypothetical protein